MSSHTAFTLVDEHSGLKRFRHRHNGLELIWAPIRLAPVATFCVVYRVGSRHEGTGHTGATHLLEHMMFKGSGSFNRELGTLPARVYEGLGAKFNATTWMDRTAYFATLDSGELERAIELEADRMRHALLDPEEFASERRVVLNELDRGENEPFDLLLKGAFATAYWEHSYRHPTIGWRGDVETISVEALRGFYDRYYHPANATAIVSGDVDEERALALVDRHFGMLPAGPLNEHRCSVEQIQEGERRFSLSRRGDTGWLSLAWPIPPARHEDLAALQVAAHALAGGVSSRLVQRLVEPGRCLSTSAWAWELHDPGLFQLIAAVAPGEDLGEIEAELKAEVLGLAADGLEAGELQRARAQLRTALAFRFESSARMVSLLTESIACGDWTLALKEPAKLAAVTSDDVVRVVERYLVDEKLSVGTFVPDRGGAGGSEMVAEATALKAATTPRKPRPCGLDGGIGGRCELHPLGGGARLAYVRSPHAPTFSLCGSLRAGIVSALEIEGDPAVAPVVAAMLQRGTESLDRLAFARELEDHGLSLGFEAGSGRATRLGFAGNGLIDEAPRLIDLLVDGLRNPRFDKAELARLKQRFIGLLESERSDSSDQAATALFSNLYPAGHPHHRRSVDTRLAALDRLGVAELRSFHERAFSRDSLLISAVGQLEGEAVAAMLRQALEGFAEGPAASSEAGPTDGVGAPAGTSWLVPLEDRPNLDILLAHRANLMRSDGDLAATRLANGVLGMSTLTSRLGARLRDQAGLTYGVVSRLTGGIDLPGQWLISVSLSAGDLGAALPMIDEVVEGFLRDGPTAEELEIERRATAGSYRVGLATGSALAWAMADLLLAGCSTNELDAYPTRVLETSREAVVAAAAKHIRPRQLILAGAGSFADADLEAAEAWSRARVE